MTPEDEEKLDSLSKWLSERTGFSEKRCREDLIAVINAFSPEALKDFKENDS